MKSIDTRITRKRTLSAKEYGEALREHYAKDKQRERIEIFKPLILSEIEKKKQSTKEKTITFTNLYKAISLDQEHFIGFLQEIEKEGYKTKYIIDLEEGKDKVEITWN